MAIISFLRGRGRIGNEYEERTDTVQNIGPRTFLPRHKSLLEGGGHVGTWL